MLPLAMAGLHINHLTEGFRSSVKIINVPFAIAFKVYVPKSINLPTLTSRCPPACFSSEEHKHPRASSASSAPLLSLPGWPRGVRGLPSTSRGAGDWRIVPLRLEQAGRSPGGHLLLHPQLHAASPPRLEQRQTNTGRAVCIRQGLCGQAGREQWMGLEKLGNLPTQAEHKDLNCFTACLGFFCCSLNSQGPQGDDILLWSDTLQGNTHLSPGNAGKQRMSPAAFRFPQHFCTWG